MEEYNCTFSPEQELEQVGYEQAIESRLFGITRKGLRKLAYQLA
jgi:hypothetical protein